MHATCHYLHAYTYMLDSSLVVSVYFRIGLGRAPDTRSNSQPQMFSSPWKFSIMNNLQYMVVYKMCIEYESSVVQLKCNLTLAHVSIQGHS